MTSRAFVVNPALLGALSDDPHQARDRFSSAFLLATATGLIRDVAVLTDRARVVEHRLATFTMDCEIGFASPATFRAFTEELAAQVATLASTYDNATARSRRFRVVVGSDSGWHAFLRTLRHYLEHHGGRPRTTIKVVGQLSGSPEDAWARLVAAVKPTGTIVFEHAFAAEQGRRPPRK